MPRGGGLKVQINVSGLRPTLTALARLPKDAQNELRDGALKLAERLAAEAQASAIAEGSQAAAVARTVKARRDRVPVIEAGGPTRVGRNRKPAWKLLFGSEFGSNFYPQFGKPHVGSGSYWFFDTVDREQAEITAAWFEIADAIIAKFDGGA